MLYKVVKRGHSKNKPWSIVGPEGQTIGYYKTQAEANAQQRALYANEGTLKESHEKTAIKREAGMDFPPRDYAYVPDPLRPATWRLRLTEAPGEISADQVMRAALALSPRGHQGNRVEIPQTALSSVKRRLLAEFRRLGVAEGKIPPSVKEVSLLGNSDFMVWKDIRSGLLRWFTVYSNNFRDQDNPPEIITEKSHKRYVELVDSGLVDYPELWLWHTPGTTWGKADWLAYSDGFAMASGIVHPGFEKIAENVARYKDIKVSHGMPILFLLYDENAGDEIIYHITMEISVLPAASAANKLTGFAVLGKGDISMALPKAKKEFLEEVGLGKAVIDQLEEGLEKARRVAQESGMESKERSNEDYDEDEDEESEDYDDDGEYDDSDEDDDDESEDYDDDDDSEDSDDDGEQGSEDTAEKARKRMNNKRVNWNSDQNKPRRGNTKRVNWNSDENKPRRRGNTKRVNWNSDKNPPSHSKRVNWNSDENKPRRGNTKRVNWNSDRNTDNTKRVNWNSDENKPRRRGNTKRVNWNSDRNKEANTFVTRDEVASVIVEIVGSLVQGNQELNEQVIDLTKEVRMLKKEIAYLQDTDEQRMARTKEVTPSLSLGEIIRQNLVGKDAAKVKGNSRLGHEGPVETPMTNGSNATMVPLINSFIDQAQRNGNG